jgi:starch phosphorylase
MVREYTDHYYVPGRERARELRRRKGARARDLTVFLEGVRLAWPSVRVSAVVITGDAAEDVRVSAQVELGALRPEDVVVQVWVDPPDAPAGVLGEAAPGRRVPGRRGPVTVYDARVPARLAPLGSVIAVRVLPTHPELDDPLSTGCVAWSE